MDRDAIIKNLKTRALGHDLLVLDEVDSTNSHAARLFAEGRLKDGMAIIADRQTAGRGRFNRAWHSGGGLSLTVALEFPDADVGPVALAAGVGVVKGLRAACGRDFFLKYPNDIISERENGKKLGGLLAELKTCEGRYMVLLGIGINVEQENFPPELAGSAVSLRQLGVAATREAVAAAVLAGLEPELELVRQKDAQAVRREWMKCECTLGKTVSVTNIAPAVEGIAVALDERGALVVETPRGLMRVSAGDILIGN